MSLLNKTNVRAFALAEAKRQRPAVGFTRVSEEFFKEIEGALRNSIWYRIYCQPSIGKTIK